MKILVTGSGGFLGKHVVRELENREHTVVSFRSFRQNTTRIRDRDLLDEGWTNDQICRNKPDVVIHLAAKCGGIGANMEKPGEFFYDNLKMGLNVIESCSKQAISKIVVLGTVCGYPKYAPIPFKEETFWDGMPEETNAPYGIAKKVLLTMLQAYRQQYGFNGIYLIPVNLFGPNDHFGLENSHVIPALIRKFDAAKETGQSVTLWGTGSASREFLYVKDAAKAIADATEKYNGSEPVNIGAGFEITIKALAELIAKLIGFEGEIIWNTEMPDGQPRRCLDVSRAEKYFGFKAMTPFKEGLKETIEWYVNNKSDILAKGDL